MNPVEEITSDIVAFRLTELQQLRYDFVVRGLLAREGGRNEEYDIIGVRVDRERPRQPVLDCIETKLGAGRRDQRRALREQLRRRRDEGCFRRVWGMWDSTDRDLADTVPGCGTLAVAGDRGGLRISQRRRADELPLRGVDPPPVLRVMRQYVDHWLRFDLGPVVFLHCLGCGAHRRFGYPFPLTFTNEYPRKTNGTLDRHAFFCPQSGRRAAYASWGTTLHGFTGGEWDSSWSSWSHVVLNAP